MKLHDIEIDDQRIAEFCRRNSIRELMVFGSLTRGDFKPNSDIDMAIEYEPGAKVSLLDFAGHELALTEMIGRPVHLTEKSTIPTVLVNRVLAGAIRAYAA